LYTQFSTAWSLAQTTASERFSASTTPTPVNDYDIYNVGSYTPPPSPALVETSPEPPAAQFGKDKRQDSGSLTYVYPEIAAAYAWPLNESQQAVLDSDSWNMWYNEPVCFWSNMLNIYLQAANLNCKSLIFPLPVHG
jgi:hypothetical protein